MDSESKGAALIVACAAIGLAVICGVIGHFVVQHYRSEHAAFTSCVQAGKAPSECSQALRAR